MKKKFKILAAGDIHGDSKQAEKLAKQAKTEEVDLVILTGDITHFKNENKNLISPFTKRKQKVLFIPGNHDSFATADFMAEFYGITNLHGYSAVYEKIGIFGCGGANVGIEGLSEEDIFNTLKKGHTKIKSLDRKIMVTHVHPEGSHMEKFTKWFPGSKGVTKAIKKLKPDILLCSHVHEAEGIEEEIENTKVINVGRKGRIIEL